MSEPPVRNVEPSVSRAARSKYLPVIVVFIAFVLRLLVFRAMSGRPERFFQPDSSTYHQLAVNLVEFHSFGSPGPSGTWMPEVNRTPLYPAFVATIYAVLGPLPTVAILVQVLLSTLTVTLAFRLGDLWASRRAGTWVAAWMSIEVGSVIYANQLMTETLFSCLFLGGMVVWSAMVQQKRWQYGFLSGLLLGLGTLVRPVLFYFVAAVGLLSLLLYPRGGKKRWQSAFAIVLTFAVVVAPWMIRNYLVMGRAELSVIQARNLLWFNVGHLRAFQQDISYDAARVQIEGEVQRETSELTRHNLGKLTAYYQHKAFAEIRAHWVEYMLVHLKGSLLFFVVPTAGTVARALGWVRAGTGLLSNLMNRGLVGTWQAFRDFHRQLTQTGYSDWLFFGVLGYELLFLSLVNLGAARGAARCLCTRRWGVLLLAATVVSYFALVTGPVSYDARYRIPIVPFLAILAVLGPTRKRASLS